MFNSLLSGGSLRLHLADKGACVSLLDPDTPGWLLGESASFIKAENDLER